MGRFKLNEKGFYISMTTIAVFLLTTLLVFLMLPQLTRMVSASKDNENTLEEFVLQRNFDERIAALLNVNPSFYGEKVYPEEEYGTVLVTEVDATYDEIITTSYNFTIENATDITVDFLAVPAPGFGVSYTATLEYDGSVVASAIGDRITLPAVAVYNPMNGDTKYGEYTIYVTTYDGTSVTHQVTYDKLLERVVKVRTATDERNIYFNFN